MISKKHFEAIVKILADNKYKEHTDLLNDFCNFFKSENPNFSNERFWESHEAFEGVWKKCSGQEKETVQGIILLAVAFGHAQRDEISVGIGMLKRVLEKIEKSSPKYHSIDIDRIRNNTIQMQKENKLTLFEI